MNSITNKTHVDLLICLVSDFTGDECSSENKCNCAPCAAPGAFLVGENAGHSVILGIWIFTLILGFCAIISNILIILILGNKRKISSFDISILILAFFDVWSSIASVIGATGYVLVLENWTRSYNSTAVYVWAALSAYFGGSCSSYMTVLISIERFIAIQFPLKNSNWFTPTRAALLALGVFLTSAFINIPIFLSLRISPNYCDDIESLKDLPYLVTNTEFAIIYFSQIWIIWIRDFLNFWIPFPLLFLMTLGSYRKVLQVSNKRQEMTLKMEKELNAAKMFIPVVVIYFISQVLPVSLIILMKATGKAYRETYVGVFWSITFAASANFPIYYFRGSGFRNETKKFLRNIIRKDKDCPTSAASTNSQNISN